MCTSSLFAWDDFYQSLYSVKNNLYTNLDLYSKFV